MNYRRNDGMLFFYVFFIVVVLGLGIWSSVVVLRDCGFSSMLLYGKNAFWAWYFGYC